MSFIKPIFTHTAMLIVLANLFSLILANGMSAVHPSPYLGLCWYLWWGGTVNRSGLVSESSLFTRNVLIGSNRCGVTVNAESKYNLVRSVM